MLTAERLRQILSYNCETGEFTWLVRCGPRKWVAYISKKQIGRFASKSEARKARVAAEIMVFGRFARQQPHGS